MQDGLLKCRARGDTDLAIWEVMVLVGAPENGVERPMSESSSGARSISVEYTSKGSSLRLSFCQTSGGAYPSRLVLTGTTTGWGTPCSDLPNPRP